MEHILKPGDPCGDCQQLGFRNYLRYFYINLDDKILKCESNTCLYPYEDDDKYGDEDFVQNVETQFVDSEKHPIFTQLHCRADGGMEFFDDLLNDNTQIKTDGTQLNTDSTQLQTDTSTPLELNSTLSESTKGTELSAPPAKSSENFTITKIQTGNWVQYAHVWNESSTKKVADKTVSAAPSKDSDSSRGSSDAAGVTNASNAIPQARIKRFLDAINTHKNAQNAQTMRKQNTPKKGRGARLKHLFITKDAKTESRNKVKPLDLLQDIIKDKSNM